VYVNSGDNPTLREASRMTTVNLERLAIMFGGFTADQIYHETWYFNLFTNMWQQLTLSVTAGVSNSAIPPGLIGHSLISSEFGIVLYGGQSWTKADLDITDADYEAKSIYESE
jgi:hypothetical protein